MTNYLPHLQSSHLHSSHLQDLHLPHSHFAHSHLPHLQASLLTVLGTTAKALAKQLQRMERKAVFIRNQIVNMKLVNDSGSDSGPTRCGPLALGRRQWRNFTSRSGVAFIILMLPPDMGCMGNPTGVLHRKAWCTIDHGASRAAILF
jgi:hypothetical protein